MVNKASLELTKSYLEIRNTHQTIQPDDNLFCAFADRECLMKEAVSIGWIPSAVSLVVGSCDLGRPVI